MATSAGPVTGIPSPTTANKVTGSVVGVVQLCSAVAMIRALVSAAVDGWSMEPFIAAVLVAAPAAAGLRAAARAGKRAGKGSEKYFTH